MKRFAVAAAGDPGNTRRVQVFSVGEIGAKALVPSAFQTQLETGLESAKNAIVQEVAERNSHYFETEMDKLETWADDPKQGLERELQELDKDIKAVKKEARQAGNLDSKVELHKKVKELEKRRNNKRKKL